MHPLLKGVAAEQEHINHIPCGFIFWESGFCNLRENVIKSGQFIVIPISSIPTPPYFAWTMLVFSFCNYKLAADRSQDIGFKFEVSV